MSETKFTILGELTNDLTSPKALPALFTGVINGTLLVLISVSFAAMIFAGDMAGFASRGAGLTLFGTGAMGVAVLLLSGIKCHVAITQDAPTATLVAATPIAATLLQRSGEAAFMTLTAILFLSSLVTGIVYLLIGRYQLANLFRFVPFPVVGGFLAGSGCLLIHGGIGVVCGLTPTLGNLHLFFSPGILWKGFPGLVFALLLFVLMQRHSHYLLLPLALMAGALGYYVVFALSGLPLEVFRKSGYLISGVPDGGLWPSFSFDSLAAIHWELVLRQTPLALTVALISTLGMLLNTSGIEVAAAEDIDLNREFKTLGAANLVAGLGGSLPGYSALSLTMLGVKTGAVTRLCGVVSTAMVFSVLFLGGWLLTWFPTPLLGSLLVLLGLFFIWDWLVRTFRKMPILDYMLILAITLTIVWKGFLPGVALGIAATLMIFVIRFSRVSPIHAVFDLSRRQSRKQRSVPDRHLLAVEGGSALGFELTGYLFFGSASAFVEKVRGQLGGSVRLLFLDFRRVTGFDVSAENNFQRLLQITSKAGIHTFLSHCPPALEQSLRRQAGGLLTSPANDLESALESGEELLLTKAHERLAQDGGSGRSALFDATVDEMMLRLERLEWCESLLERLSCYGRTLSCSRNETVLREGEVVPGMMILVAGKACEANSKEVAGKEWEAGAVLYPHAQFQPALVEGTLTAASELHVFFLELEGRRRIEGESPVLALELDRYILSKTSAKGL